MGLRKKPLNFAVASVIGAALVAVTYWGLTSRGPAPGEIPTGSDPPATAPAEQPVLDPVRFTDVTETAGIAFRHEGGARGKMLNPETFGSGCGWIDYDGDGLQDLLLVNSNLLEGPLDPQATSILYRNLGDGRFQDVTREAGLDIPLYGMGFVSADVEGDGDQDLLLYGLHRSVFFVNGGDGRFVDRTAEAGLGNLKGWVCAATFLDYDRDGWLDLYVGNYVTWSAESEVGVDCTFGTPEKKYCPVAVFEPSAPQLFRGRGDGTFAETTEKAGLASLKGKTLGVVLEDYDRDGFPDLLVANDSVPNFLLHNRGDGTFEDRGIDSGFATDADGAALAGMGIDTAWAPNGGPLLTAIGNFSGEPATFHIQEGVDYFVERSFSWGIGRETLDRVTFGLLLFDADLNGALDLLLVNGHVFDVEDITGVPYAQKAQLFLATDWQSFREMRPEDPADFFNRPIVGRAVAFADYDRDGDLDLAVTVNQGPAILLRNDLEGPRSFVRIDLRGTGGQRDAIGAEATLHLRGPGGGSSVRMTRKSVSSYLAQNERQLTFGVADGMDIRGVEVLWTSGKREYFAGIPRNREVLLVEGRGGVVPEAELAMARAPTAAGTPGGKGSTPERSNPVILRRRGAELYRMARFSEALEAFEEAIGLDGHDFVTQRFALMALFRLGRAADVNRKVGEIARIFPDARLLVSHFALVLRESGYPELSERLFREAIQLDPRRVDVCIALANFAFDRGDHDDAMEFYRRAVSLKPDSVEALANIGKVHTIQKRYDQAQHFLERALALRPDYATALSTLGGVMIELGEYPRAEEYLRSALDLPGSEDTRLTIHGNLGILYYKMGDRDRAREAFEKVLAIDPADRQAQRVLERLSR